MTESRAKLTVPTATRAGSDRSISPTRMIIMKPMARMLAMPMDCCREYRIWKAFRYSGESRVATTTAMTLNVRIRLSQL